MSTRKSTMSTSARKAASVAANVAVRPAGKGTSRSSRRKRNKNGGAGSVAVRNIVTASMPKTGFSFSNMRQDKSGDPLVTITGCEVIGEVVGPSSLTMGPASQTVLDIVLNPANSQLFPRLSGIAQVFDKFRFKSVTVTYHSGCPSTLAGSVGVGFITDPNDPTPINNVALCEYAHAAAGTVTMPLSATIRPNDDVWQFTSAAIAPAIIAPVIATAQYSSGQVNPFYGSLRLCVKLDHATNATANLFLGYLSISYEIELLRIKPVQQSVCSGTWANMMPSTLTSTSAGTSKWLPIGTNKSTVEGYFDTFSSAINIASDLYNAYQTYPSSRIPNDTSLPWRYLHKGNTLAIGSGDFACQGDIDFTNPTATRLTEEEKKKVVSKRSFPLGFRALNASVAPIRRGQGRVPSGIHLFVSDEEEKSEHPTFQELWDRFSVIYTGTPDTIPEFVPINLVGVRLGDNTMSPALLGTHTLGFGGGAGEVESFNLPISLSGPYSLCCLADTTGLTASNAVTQNFCSLGYVRLSPDNSDFATPT